MNLYIFILIKLKSAKMDRFLGKKETKNKILGNFWSHRYKIFSFKTETLSEEQKF